MNKTKLVITLILISLLLLFGCSKSKSANKEEIMGQTKDIEAVNAVIDSENDKETQIKEKTINEFNEKVNIEEYIKTSKDLFGQEITNTENIEVNALYLTNDDFPEIVVSCTYNKNTATDTADILIFQKNKLKNKWEKIYIYEEMTSLDYVGSLNNNSLQLPVFYKVGGLIMGYQEAIVVIYDDKNDCFIIENAGPSVGIEHGYSTPTVENNKIVWSNIKTTEELMWNGEEFTYEEHETYKEVTYKEFVKNSMLYENKQVLIQEVFFRSYDEFDEYKERIEFHKYNDVTNKADYNFPVLRGKYNDQNVDFFKSVLIEYNPYVITGTAKKYSDSDKCYIVLDNILKPWEYTELFERD